MKNLFKKTFLVILSTLLFSFGGIYIYGFYQNFITSSVVNIENIIYGADYNGYLKGDVVNGDINFTFTITGEKQDGTPKVCSASKTLTVINGLSNVDSSTLSCDFNEFKQGSIITMSIKGDLDGNGNYTDTVDYNTTLQSIFRTFYNKTYMDSTITTKAYLLDGNGIILYNKLPF